MITSMTQGYCLSAYLGTYERSTLVPVEPGRTLQEAFLLEEVLLPPCGTYVQSA